MELILLVVIIIMLWFLMMSMDDEMNEIKKLDNNLETLITRTYEVKNEIEKCRRRRKE